MRCKLNSTVFGYWVRLHLSFRSELVRTVFRYTLDGAKASDFRADVLYNISDMYLFTR